MTYAGHVQPVSATGALQAAQAGNQLSGAAIAAALRSSSPCCRRRARADALEQARVPRSAEAQGQQNYKTFSTRTGYQPGNVTMFSGN